VNELLRILKLIQYKENSGHAYPVDWKYGDQILYYHPLKSKVYLKHSILIKKAKKLCKTKTRKAAAKTI
jgi:hypothetical protein